VCGQIAKPFSRSGARSMEMEVLGAMLLVLPLIGVPVAIGARRRDRKGDPKQRDGILASESIVTSKPRSVEPVPTRAFLCGCNTAGCTVTSGQAEMKRPSRLSLSTKSANNEPAVDEIRRVRESEPTSP
jgi:hypothetical protein